MAWPRCAQVLLREGQRLALRDADLQLDQVAAGHHLGHRVLDLEARVHLQEVGLAVRVHQELERARVAVADALARAPPPARPCARAAPAVTNGDGLSSTIFWWRRWIEHSRSNRWTASPWWSASTWISMWRGLHDRLLQVDAVVAEGGLRLAPRALARPRPARRGVRHEPQALAAAARGRLQHEREADALRLARRWPSVPATGSSVPGTTGTPASTARRRAEVFSPMSAMVSLRGPMKTRPASSQARANVGVLGQEAVAGVDGVGARLRRRLQDAVDAAGTTRATGAGPIGVGLVGHAGRAAPRGRPRSRPRPRRCPARGRRG